MSRYQALALTTVVATLILIAVGSTVRTTGSGLGCPDWPLCHGRLLPPLERTAIIEYSHRTTAAAVGVLIVATVIVTLRLRRDDRALSALAIGALPLLGLQAYLGKVTVDRELPAEVVTVHLSMALVLLAVLALIATFAFQGAGRTPIATAERRRFTTVAVIAAAVTAGVVVIGSYLVGSDAGFACTSWPGCREAPLPFLDGGRLQSIHWLHRLTVALGAVAIGAVALTVWQMRDAGRWLQRGTHALAGLFALQVLSGALNIWSDFAEAARVLHLVLGSATWAMLVVLAVAGRYRPVVTDAPPLSAAVRDSAETSHAHA